MNDLTKKDIEELFGTAEEFEEMEKIVSRPIKRITLLEDCENCEYTVEKSYRVEDYNHEITNLILEALKKKQKERTLN